MSLTSCAAETSWMMNLRTLLKRYVISTLMGKSELSFLVHHPAQIFQPSRGMTPAAVMAKKGKNSSSLSSLLVKSKTSYTPSQLATWLRMWYSRIEGKLTSSPHLWIVKLWWWTLLTTRWLAGLVCGGLGFHGRPRPTILLQINRLSGPRIRNYTDYMSENHHKTWQRFKLMDFLFIKPWWIARRFSHVLQHLPRANLADLRQKSSKAE